MTMKVLLEQRPDQRYAAPAPRRLLYLHHPLTRTPAARPSRSRYLFPVHWKYRHRPTHLQPGRNMPTHADTPVSVKIQVSTFTFNQI